MTDNAPAHNVPAHNAPALDAPASDAPAPDAPAFDTPATPAAADLVLTPSSESAIVPLHTELSLVAERLLRRPDALERLAKKHLKTLTGP